MHTKGFSTVELLIAFSVGLIFLSGAAMVAFGGQTASLDAILTTKGLHSATSYMEDALRTVGFSWHAELSPGTDPEGVYSYAAQAADTSPCTKEIISTTIWNSEHKRSLGIAFGSVTSNMDVAQALGPGGCDPTPPSEWERPRKYDEGVFVEAINANDLIVSHDQGKRIVFLATVPEGEGEGVTTDDLVSYDLSDPSDPSEILGSIDTGKGINAIATDGHEFIFAVQNDTTNQLQVIRMFDRTKPKTNPQYYQPTLEVSVPLDSVEGVYPEGRSIAYYDDFLYIGTWNNNVPGSSPEFLIYDMSDPLNPNHRGSLNLGRSVNSIAIQGSYAYLATTNNDEELTIIDISDPDSPKEISAYDIPNVSDESDAEEIFVLGNYVYVGMGTNAKGQDKEDELLVIDISNPLAPERSAGIHLDLKTKTKVTGLWVQGNYIFVGTDVSNEEFRVVYKNGDTLTTLECSPYNYSAKLSALTYDDGYIFASNQANDALRVIYDDTDASTCPN